MAGSIKIQHGGTASTPQAGFSTLWVRSSDGEFYYTKPNGSSEPLVGATGTAVSYYGNFLSTVSQTNAGATAANAITYNTTDLTSGVSVVSSSRITVANAGIYNIEFSAQLQKASGGDDQVDIWLAKNGSNVANSNTTIMMHSNPGYEVAAWNFLVQANAADYYELYWSSADTTAQLHAASAGTSPTRPAIPSVILSVTQISAA